MDIKTFSSIKLAILCCLTTLFLVSCGGGSEDEDSIAPESSDNQKPSVDAQNVTGNVYMVVRAVNYNEESSGLSNEVSTLIQNASEAIISFNEPNLQMDGNCLTSQISRYIVHYGSASGSYTGEITINRNSTQLTCSTVGAHAQCGNVTNCSTTISL